MVRDRSEHAVPPPSPLPAGGPFHRSVPAVSRALFGGLLLALLLVPALPLAAQTAQPTADPAADATEDAAGGEIFFEQLSVNIVNVDVFVTDKKGEPATGLTADDFEIYEDGRPMEVSNFYSVDGPATPAERLRSVEALQLPDAPPLETLPDFERPADQKLHLIVFVDNLFMSPFNRNRVMRELDSFLRLNTQPGDEAMLVSFDRSLNIRQPFTGDMRLISRAMDQLMDVRTFGEQQKTERKELIRRIESAGSVGAAMADVDFYAKSLHHDSEVALRQMSELVGSLGGLPGRKALLMVSEGPPMTAGEDLFALVDLKFPGSSSVQLHANRYRLRREFRHLVARANSNRVTFYTLDALGAYTHTGVSAEYGNVAQSVAEVDFLYDSSRQEPLEVLAEGTGGRATLSTANFGDALARIAQDLTTYYSLGYASPHIDDGRYHEIEVRVKKPGLEVRHRQGYRAKTAESRLADGTAAALLYGASVNPLAVDLQFGTPQSNGQGTYLVPVLVRIPIGSMALLPRGTEHHGRLRVAVAVKDDRGDTSPPNLEPFPVLVPEAELADAKQRYYTYSANLLMQSGTHQVAVGVADEIAGATSFLRRSVRVGGGA